MKLRLERKAYNIRGLNGERNEFIDELDRVISSEISVSTKELKSSIREIYNIMAEAFSQELDSGRCRIIGYFIYLEAGEDVYRFKEKPDYLVGMSRHEILEQLKNRMDYILSSFSKIGVKLDDDVHLDIFNFATYDLGVEIDDGPIHEDCCDCCDNGCCLNHKSLGILKQL